MDTGIDTIRTYWDTYPLGGQYVFDRSIKPGTREFFEHIRPWMNPYKFSWIMERIELEAARLVGKRLLEIGCGMGYDSLEFMRRGVNVTAIDLSPAAIDYARRHFAHAGAKAEQLAVGDALDLPFGDSVFDAVWANGVFHHTGDTRRAVAEAWRVLKPGGRAIISHFYRKPSWMYMLHRIGRENIEHKEEDPPVTEFYTESEIESMFEGFEIAGTYRDHYRALPVARRGLKAWFYKNAFLPVYNMLPELMARKFAYKYSVIAVKI